MTSRSDSLCGPATRCREAGVGDDSGASSQRAASRLLWVKHGADQLPLNAFRTNSADALGQSAALPAEAPQAAPLPAEHGSQVGLRPHAGAPSLLDRQHTHPIADTHSTT